MYPMRFAGIMTRYSKNAIAQLTSAAIHHALLFMLRRCAYHANVMMVLEMRSMMMVMK